MGAMSAGSVVSSHLDSKNFIGSYNKCSTLPRESHQQTFLLRFIDLWLL